MGAGKVNWDSQETWQRVVAAIIATGVKVDLKQTALYFGTTYDTLENRFRKIKKESEVLKNEVSNGERSQISTPSRSTPKKPSPKKDALANVTNGRVTKSTPKKKSSIKQESFNDSTSFDIGDDFSFTNSSFSLGHGINGEDDDGLDLLV
ncbi:uncharacterized protein MYCFIDRAFT_87101 [Pseudocercospora fijiensis CIRAD86]|uniref:Myb-like domain-containing protein n=1 Tax=Pseudocercospora fijiensis (strain CIRAD86) TaxID=383855 RepID=M3AXC3_PSEFD|nr:uncharacterized protein MYCFIDRAFT_87101 [Pseudocercospora fijiensis CIRAD86]EME81738.1 hypothetical protein MYCFIDRAFT_87101 [Pseudocercospora fijiensis CIRAD86]